MAELVRQCAALRPDLVVADIRMPDMDGIEAAEAICRASPTPVVLVTAFHDRELGDRAQNHVMAYLIKPIKRAELEAAIPVAMRRFQHLQALLREAVDLRQALEDRKVIERAKGVLMQRARLTEQDAFRRLQHLARQNNRKLVDVARSLLLAEEALQGEPAE